MSKPKKDRKAVIERKTRETQIRVKLDIDGRGASKIDTGIGFLNHMLELFGFWGFFDLEISAKGDLKVDIHHTNEDVGLVLGQAFKEALADKEGIKRIGFASAPMEDVAVSVVVDISGRSFLRFPSAVADFSTVEEYEIKDAVHFFDSFAKHSGMNLSIDISAGNFKNTDLHANLEPVFKALGIALDQATQIDLRRKGIPSTKGIID